MCDEEHAQEQLWSGVYDHSGANREVVIHAARFMGGFFSKRAERYRKEKLKFRVHSCVYTDKGKCTCIMWKVTLPKI